MTKSFTVLRFCMLLLIGIAAAIAATSVAARFVGDRIYILNNTECRLTVMEEHDSHSVNSGQSVLVKPGLIEHTPTMFILSDEKILFRGLRFSMEKLQVREQNDIAVPKLWRSETFFGATLTYKISGNGEFTVQPPIGTNSNALQPLGLPLRPASGTRLVECNRS